MSTRRAGGENGIGMFTLKNKEELNRNIPFGSLNNIDFGTATEEFKSSKKYPKPSSNLTSPTKFIQDYPTSILAP